MLNVNHREHRSFVAGDKLEERSYTPTAANIFMYSAITWNRHLIHYSKDQAMREGHEDVPVQRGLIGNYFTRYVNELFESSFILTLSWKVKATAYPDQVLVCCGDVASVLKVKTDEIIELDLQLSSQKRLISTATATVQL